MSDDVSLVVGSMMERRDVYDAGGQSWWLSGVLVSFPLL
jgi:hypothetical protein